MSKVGILASVFALAVGTVGCGNSQGQSNSLVDVGPSMVSSTPSDEGGGNLTTLAKGGGGGGGKRGGGTTTTGGGSLSLVMVTDNNHDGLPNRGDTITYNVSTTATTEPTVDLNCSQNGGLVLSSTTGFYASYPWPWTNNMTLVSAAWASGAADCTATLHALGSSTILASIRFTAGG